MTTEDDCRNGNHVPCATVDKHNRVFEVFCQKCLKPMTKEDYTEFFRARRPWALEGINWDEKADPNDVDIFTDTDDWEIRR